MARKKLARDFRKMISKTVLSCEQLEDRRLLAALAANQPHVSNEVLVQYVTNANASQKAQALGLVKGSIAETIHTKPMQASGMGQLERVKLGSGVGIQAAIDALSKNPFVKFAEPNYIYRPSVVSNDTYYTNGSLWGMYGDDSPVAIGPAGTTNQFGSHAEKVWNDNITGKASVFVGVIDEGIQVNHPDLVDNIWVNPHDPIDGVDNDGNGYVDDKYGWDFVNNDNSVYDAGGDAHGTHVAGTIGGTGGNNSGVVGVNWDVTMISTKFLGTNGGTTADAVKALDYLTDLKNRHGINIVASNNSWGGGGYSQSLHDAIIRSAKKDILFVAAAGNSTSNNDSVASYPSNYNTTIGTSTQTAAAYDSVIAVASIMNTGAISSFSSYGATTVDIGAPGSGIWSSVPSNSYASYNGTSMATPHVAGAVALYASTQSAGVSAASIKQAILSSATATASLAGKTVTGGRLNVYEAIRRSNSITLDSSVYAVPDTILLNVNNPAANLSGTVIDTVTVTVRSTLESTPESLVLTETGVNSGQFTGSLQTVSGTPVADGKLQVAHGDQITAVYAAINKSATATVDAVGPTISNISSTAKSVSAEIRWLTDEPATSEVLYGTSATNLNQTYSSTSLATNQLANLVGLTPSTNYFYQVRSRDTAGNVTTSVTNSFTTTAPAPILFVDDDMGAAYERFYNAALAANQYSYDTWNVAGVGRTPTAAELNIYDMVIWNTGYEFTGTGAGLSSTAEQNAIASYLNGGGRMLISGQDVLYSGVSLTFQQNYLKVANYGNEILTTTSHTETGVTGNLISNGMSLSSVAPSDYPTLYVDQVSPVVGAEGTFRHGVTTATYPFSAVNYRGDYANGGFGMIFMTFPFESISTSAASPNNQATFMKRAVEYLMPTNVGPSIQVSAPSPSATTTEASGAVSFTVVLGSAPTADVTIPVMSSDTTEGTVDKASLLFTPTNWNMPQSVTVSGVDDFVDDANVGYTVQFSPAISVDGAYGGLVASAVSLTNQDNDTAGITRSGLSGTMTTEAGGKVTFNIRLNSEPIAQVAIGVSSDKTAEGTVSPASLVFNSSNWNVDQTVTVTGVDDAIYDGNVTYNVILAQAVSNDTSYSVINPADLVLTNQDNDPAPATKFFVVDDATPDRTYEYSVNTPITNFTAASANTAPRGAAMTSLGTTLWVVDANRTVYVYDTSTPVRSLMGSWVAGTLASNANVQGIATDGTHIWIVDSRSDRVFYYANAASRITNSQAAFNSTPLNTGNTNPTDLVFGADGANRSLWVVNSGTTDRVYRYTVATNGTINTTSPVSWALNSSNSTPTGITLDPSNGSFDIWVVDNGTDRVYRYANARNLSSPSLTDSFALAPGNTNPQGIADPPPVGLTAVSMSTTAASSVAASAVPLIASNYAAGNLFSRMASVQSQSPVRNGTLEPSLADPRPMPMFGERTPSTLSIVSGLSSKSKSLAASNSAGKLSAAAHDAVLANLGDLFGV